MFAADARPKKNQSNVLKWSLRIGKIILVISPHLSFDLLFILIKKLFIWLQALRKDSKNPLKPVNDNDVMHLETETKLRFYQICETIYKSNIYGFSMLFQFDPFYNEIQSKNKYFVSRYFMISFQNDHWVYRQNHGHDDTPRPSRLVYLYIFTKRKK